jgi:glycine hydroxymethyltransferase
LNKIVFPGLQGGPFMHIIAAKAVAFKEALSPSFAEYTDKVIVNAKTLAEAMAGHGYRIVSGGTDNHLFLLDVFSKGITGKEGEIALDKAGVTVNKNTIPFDENPPMVASGLRIGTPALTTRGMGPSEMAEVGEFIARGLAAREDDAELARIRAEVGRFAADFPLYPSRLPAQT